jgi:uncharacterized membrane protein YccC
VLVSFCWHGSMLAYLAGAVCCGVVRLVPDTPVPDELAWLRARVAELEEVTARLRQAARDRDELAAAQLAARDAQVAALAAQVEELRRLLGKDSSTSSRPPSSDSPYKKKPRDRSLRGRSGRRPGSSPARSPPR